jgi:hypothetical protein
MVLVVEAYIDDNGVSSENSETSHRVWFGQRGRIENGELEWAFYGVGYDVVKRKDGD